ncbi:Dimethyladenosine transferase 1, mitochondrial [Pseudolycoriella hygida]|uniref:rRNA adenine N(6)-methyltransferase n=1 Tax=Pseudolycoriella hygida TaxID=35572 RepID=A0A9Q0NC59_9DIPT|nr:Dimethyladenosine transferase 1, mitochondrial [Pseudolycoriella hygida]
MTSASIIRKGARLPALPTIRDIIKLYRLRAIKQLSQNFLMDERLTDKIVKAAGKIENQHVLEVGPGPGCITRSIIKKMPQKLIVVEKDRRFLPSLELLAESTAEYTKMDIYEGDILKFPIETAFPDLKMHHWEGRRAPVHLIGNLPFSISTRLLINWLRDVSLQQGAWKFGRATMTLTFQKEVAERIVAPMASPQRCRLSIMSQIWTEPQLKFTIPGKAFIPKPKVDVGVVQLVPYQIPLTKLPFDLVEKVCRYIFSMRQKYLRRGISNLYPEDLRDELTYRTFQMADLNPETRSFLLSVDECLRIAEAYHHFSKIYPNIDSYNYRASKKIIHANYDEFDESY